MFKHIITWWLSHKWTIRIMYINFSASLFQYILCKCICPCLITLLQQGIGTFFMVRGLIKNVGHHGWTTKKNFKITPARALKSKRLGVNRLSSILSSVKVIGRFLMIHCIWVIISSWLSTERKKIFFKHNFIELLRCSTIAPNQDAPTKLKFHFVSVLFTIFVLLQI